MSQRVSGFTRKPADEYMTPEWVTETLGHAYPIVGKVWEPACGTGSIVNVLRRYAYADVVASDINPNHSPDGQSWDFLDPHVQASYFMPEAGPFTIVTNPPYGRSGRLAESFVRAAVEITQFNTGRVCMLLPVDWDAAKTRQDLFQRFHGHVTKITLTERIRWTNLPQSASGPSQNHAWFCWDHGRRGRDMKWLGRVHDFTRSEDREI